MSKPDSAWDSLIREFFEAGRNIAPDRIVARHRAAIETEARTVFLAQVRETFVHAFVVHPTGRLLDIDVMAILDDVARQESRP